MDELKELIEDVPGFPIEGILFRDITPLLLEPNALRRVIGRFEEHFRHHRIHRVAAIEARGFIFGAPLALALGCGFVPVRKVGKLPRRTVAVEYELEYGSNHLEIHEDAIDPGQRVLVVDDVLATGGTAGATVQLIRQMGGEVVGVGFLLEIALLQGREGLSGLDVCSLLTY